MLRLFGLLALLAAVPGSNLAQTAPGSWSERGFDGTRWGMVPGDVRAVYPDLVHRAWPNDATSSNPIQMYEGTTVLFGRRVSVFASFHSGRLYSIALHPAWEEARRAPVEWAEWRSAARRALTTKYGPARDAFRTNGGWFEERWRVGAQTQITLTDSPGIEYQHVSMKAAAIDATMRWAPDARDSRSTAEDRRF